ncbi:MAG: anti-sigma F factor [Clostridia bacterium]|nr:anti-sigma F factor [Clostridia bacterium]
MKRIINEMKLRLPARSENEGVARTAVCAFVAELNPTVEELGDVRLAVSEAVTNCVVHAYPERKAGECAYIYISARIYEQREISVEISDNGCGIENIELARTPMYTTGEYGERCGMGFLIMENLCDSVTVKSRVGKGTTVLLRKYIGPGRCDERPNE